MNIWIWPPPQCKRFSNGISLNTLSKRPRNDKDECSISFKWVTFEIIQDLRDWAPSSLEHASKVYFDVEDFILQINRKNLLLKLFIDRRTVRMIREARSVFKDVFFGGKLDFFRWFWSENKRLVEIFKIFLYFHFSFSRRKFQPISIHSFGPQPISFWVVNFRQQRAARWSESSFIGHFCRRYRKADTNRVCNPIWWTKTHVSLLVECFQGV